jgi:hypothetical protein
MHEPLGPIQVRAVMETLVEGQWGLKAICIWKSKVQDEGTRNICRYLESVPKSEVEVLDLLENEITELGC